MKTILSAGHCDFDHGHINALVESINAKTLRANSVNDALSIIEKNSINLILVNRIFDETGEVGIDFIKTLKTDQKLKSIPIMLISNYEDAQTQAVSAGAIRGFGKAKLDEETTKQSLLAIL